MAVVGAWPVPWVSYVCRRGEAGLLGPICPPGCCGQSPGPLWLKWGCGWSPETVCLPLGHGLSLGPHMATVGAWPFALASYGCRGGGAVSLGPVWPPWWECGRYPGPQMAAMGAWPVPWAPYGRIWGRGRSSGPRTSAVGSWPVFSVPSGRRGRVAGPLGPSGRRGGVVGPLGSVWPPWGRGRTPGPRLAAVGTWPVPWPQHGHCGGVAVCLGSVCLL